MSNQSRSRFRPKSQRREDNYSIPISPPSQYKPGVDWTLRDDLSVEQVLDEMSLLHAIETAGALTEAEQEAIEAREQQADELAE